MKGYDIKIRLDNFKPNTWRDLIIPENITFHQLHMIIQEIWDLKNRYSYLFTIKKTDIKYLSFEEKTVENEHTKEENEFDSRKHPISELFDSEENITYIYGSNKEWSFTITIKKNIEYNEFYPYLKRFKGEYNPIEDCGGIDALSDIVNTYENNDPVDQISIINLDKKREDLNNNCRFINSPLEKKEDNTDKEKSFKFIYIIRKKVGNKTIIYDGLISSESTLNDIHEIIKDKENITGKYWYNFTKKTQDNISKKDVKNLKLRDFIEDKEDLKYEYKLKDNHEMDIFLRKKDELNDFLLKNDYIE